MGITAFDIGLIKKALVRNRDIKNVCELGSQNVYVSGQDKPPFADALYKELGIKEYVCIDLAGDNNAYQYDLSGSLPEICYNVFNLVTDFGSGEHIVEMEAFEKVSFHDDHIHSIYPQKVISIMNGYYNCWLNKHKLLTVGGIMINVNPLTGNWPKHGYSYLTEQFYHDLVANTDYEILELGTHPASGNKKDGWNVHCILRKHSERFPDIETFKTFDIRES